MSHKANKPTYYVHTLPGVEEIAWLEIRDRFPDADFGQFLFAEDQHGIVTFAYGGSIKDIYRLRTTEDLFLQALFLPKVSRGYRDLKEIADKIAGGNAVGRALNELTRFRRFSGPPSYRIICRKFGRHEYRHGQFADAVREGFARRNPTWTPVASGGQVEIWANLLGSHLLIGLRLSDERMGRLHLNLEAPEAGIRPSLAAAMVLLTQPAAHETFLDPLCGNGSLLQERYLTRIPARLLGGDHIGEWVRAAQDNWAGSRQEKPLLAQWDAGYLPIDTHSINKAATRLPSRHEFDTDGEMPHFYTVVLQELERVLAENGRITLLSREYEQVKDSLRQAAPLQVVNGYSIAAKGERGDWGRLYIVERRP